MAGTPNTDIGGDSAGVWDPETGGGNFEKSVALYVARGLNLQRGCRFGTWNVLTHRGRSLSAPVMEV